MERDSFKEYSEAAIVEKEELLAMKSCFKELHTLFYQCDWVEVCGVSRCVFGRSPYFRFLQMIFN